MVIRVTFRFLRAGKFVLNKYKIKVNKKDELNLAIIACLTLGLAPFVPEPHILGKLRWLFGGGVGMKTMDYFDLLWHSLPWIFLFYVLIKKALRIKSKATKKPNATFTK